MIVKLGQVLNLLSPGMFTCQECDSFEDQLLVARACKDQGLFVSIGCQDGHRFVLIMKKAIVH